MYAKKIRKQEQLLTHNESAVISQVSWTGKAERKMNNRFFCFCFLTRAHFGWRQELIILMTLNANYLCADIAQEAV